MAAIKDKVNSFKDGLIHGMGWAFGVTIGFIIISAFLWFLINRLGWLPFSSQIGDLIQASRQSSTTGTPVIPD